MGTVGIVLRRDPLAIALVLRDRLTVPPEVYSDQWASWTKTGIPRPTDFPAIGVRQLEIPQGIDNDSFNEIEGEVGCHVAILEKLGQITHSGYFGTSPFVNVFEAVGGKVAIDGMESIQSVVWLTPEELATVKTLSGSTYSALFMALRWMAGQEDDVWREFARRVSQKWFEA
jgi:hypothetical protein